MAANPEWYYSKDNEQVGPITAAELKELALSGQISPSDFIWNEQWPEWKEAGSIKGFFPAPKAKPSPPPIPPASASSSPPKSANVTDTVKSDLSDFVSSAKKVKNLAVAHTRRTQITQMTLPKAYLALGKDVFSNERFRDEFSDLFQQITAKNDEIAKVSATNKERPQATDFKGKLQSGAANLMAQGQSAKLGFQRDTLLRELGKKAFESHGTSAGSPELVTPITSATDEMVSLDANIEQLSAGEKGPLWQRLPLAALLTVFCWPVGMILVWLNPGLSRRSKWIWTGVSIGMFIVLGVLIPKPTHTGSESTSSGTSLSVPKSPTHDYSRDDYSLPDGAKKEVREEPGTKGGWTISEGYVTATGDFITHGTFTRWFNKDKKHKSAVSMYRHDKLHGKGEAWYEDGQKKSEFYCVDDKTNGPSVQWWPNGQKKQEVTALNGEFHGHLGIWNENGLQTHSGMMERGKPIGKWRFGFKSIASSQPYFMEADDKPWSGGTQADFICKMHFLNLRLGNDALMLPRDHRAGPCVCRSKENFTDLFGPPASDRPGDSQFANQNRLWTYRCSDGPVEIRARSNAPQGTPWVIEIER